MGSEEPFDICVIGGGINGAGIARDAAGRGYSVLLCEKGDLASATSSASTKLIHGGLRYLEHYEFRLVREALIEREVLLAMAPHIIWPLRFVLPHDSGQRPAWLIRLGLFLYDHLGGRKRLTGCSTVDFANHPTGAALNERFRKGFVYSDCWVQDARLVVLNAMDAAEHGADVRPRCAVRSARREGSLWHVTVQDQGSAATREVRTRALVNAAGPWVTDVLSGCLAQNNPKTVRLVKGSHIVVPKLFEGDHCYIFQNEDQRIVFAIPYEGDFTLVGTTDVDYQGNPDDAACSATEMQYLCALLSRYLANPVTPDQVVWSYAGVRPLQDNGAVDAKSASRDYTLDLDSGDSNGVDRDGGGGAAPLLSVFGGKITTYRKLAEQALALLERPLGRTTLPWTATSVLPGGDLPDQSPEALARDLRQDHGWLAPGLAQRWATTYGTRCRDIIGSAEKMSDLGACFGRDLTEAELNYLIAKEWAREADDVLWRRSKLGLHMSDAERGAVAQWFAARLP